MPASRRPYASTGRVIRPAYLRPATAEPRGQPAHVGGQYRGHGEFARAEDQGKLPQPRRLVQECGETRKEKAGDDAEIHEPRRLVRWLHRRRRSRWRWLPWRWIGQRRGPAGWPGLRMRRLFAARCRFRCLRETNVRDPQGASAGTRGLPSLSVPTACQCHGSSIEKPAAHLWTAGLLLRGLKLGA